MKTVSEVLSLSTKFLSDQQVERSRRIAEELLAACLGSSRMGLYLQFDRPVVEEELISLRTMLKKCARGEPPEYAVGRVEFYHCEIGVDRRVLIPRQETEIMVDLIAKKIAPALSDRRVCWDLCTGSGCIGISLKKALPALEVTLSDLSQDALALAAENGARNGVEVSLLLGDLLEPFSGKRADFVICNPPYIRDSEYLHLQSSVRDFEPKGALVGGERGTEFYERLSAELPAVLNPGALVFLEIGKDQGEAVKEIFAGGPWASAELGKDWAGLDRFFFLEKQ